MTRDLLTFVRDLGFKVGLDYDDALIVESPLSVNPGDVAKQIERHGDTIIGELRGEREHALRRYIGGPLDGQSACGVYAPPCRHPDGTYSNGFRGFRVRDESGKRIRAKWAVYEFDRRDGRAFFRGYATSEKKARNGQCEPQRTCNG